MNETVDVASALSRFCPALATDWSVHAADLDLPYVALGHLAGRLVAVDQDDPEADFGPLFHEVERLVAGGDSATRNLLIVGFLEGLQNVAPVPERWAALLGPSTREAWAGVEAFWLGRMTPTAFNKLVDGDIGTV